MKNVFYDDGVIIRSARKIMQKNKKGLYIHVPFCRSKCIYCDFVSYSGQDGKIDWYLENLVDEMELFKGEKISTIFIGGGTPSLLSRKQLEYLFRNLAGKFDLAELEEFTIEANPESLTIEKIDFLKDNEFVKVDRISIGLQSFDDAVLQKIGRHYSVADFCKKFAEIRAAGFDNINIDIIIGWSILKTENKFLDELQNFIKKLSPEHISLYLLSIPENSKLQQMIDNKTIKDIESDIQIDEFLAAIKILKSAGYFHYEISNFAKPSKKCQHNLGYWNRTEYIGIGANACGFIGNFRYKNPSSMDDYADMVKGKKYELIREIEKLGDRERFVEEISLGLRMLDTGINLEQIRREFGFLLDEKIDDKINNFVNDGYLKFDSRKNGNVLLTEKGVCVSNSIFADMI